MKAVPAKFFFSDIDEGYVVGPVYIGIPESSHSFMLVGINADD